ncbi:MAG TPA: hypothetical protein VM841_05830, partial [Actinomycetota bacterium]|nr:hypothetical protein [Actinomycetota bacterium]
VLGGPISTLLTCAAKPAQVNNVEMGPPSTSDKLSPANTGHPNQKRGEGNRFGLYYPVTDPIQAHWTTTGPTQGNGTGLIPATRGDHFNWRLSGTCATGEAFLTQGTGIGYCGRSIGFGTGNVGPHSAIVRWESVGSQLITTDPSSAGTVNAQANPPGSANGSCLDGGASVFIVDGALVHM